MISEALTLSEKPMDAPLAIISTWDLMIEGSILGWRMARRWVRSLGREDAEALNPARGSGVSQFGV